MEAAESFRRLGFASLRELIDRAECARLIGQLPSVSGAGSRTLLAQPPTSLLQQMVAVRLHLDECGADDGPLYVVPGSHEQGIIDARDASRLRAGERACLANAGDALVMRPLLLHRSSKAWGTSRRRVLHFLFGPAFMPQGIEWREQEGVSHESCRRNN